MRARESESGAGQRVATSGPSRATRGGQAGREGGGGAARRCARWARARPPVGEEDDRGGGQWAGPALAAAGLHREEAQVSLPFYFCFLFYFSDICFDLIKILNHFITLCQFLQELAILFQSSFINGIIFGPYFIYIEIYFQCKYLSN